MAQAVVNFRIDADLKQNIEQICHEMGMSLTTAFTIFAKTLDRERRIPFEIKADPFYSDANMARLRHSIAQMESSGGTVHEVNDLD